MSRRHCLSGSIAIALFTEFGKKGFADSLQGRLAPALRREIADVFGMAEQLGIQVPSQDRSAPMFPAIDIATIVLNALGKPNNKRALALAVQGGRLLSSINQANRDLFPPTEAERRVIPPPPFDEREKVNLRTMFESCEVNPDHKAEIAKAVKLMTSPAAKVRYDEVAAISNVPWYVIASLHYREASLNFLGHLHNGNRLDRLTTDVPSNRPFRSSRPNGMWPPVPYDPRVAWRISAVDAMLDFKRIHAWKIEQMLYGFEQYNGFGYRLHKMNSPYVWSYSQYYLRGGYPCDNCWSNSYLSKQAGLAPIIKALRIAAPGEVNLVYDT